LQQSQVSTISDPELLVVNAQNLLTTVKTAFSSSWFHRSVRLVMASLSIDDKSKHHDAKVEAKARHKDIAEVQFRELQYWLGFLDDLLSCDIRIWNARLVEWILREVVVGTILLRWNRSLDFIGRKSTDRTKGLQEIYKAHAEIRVSIVFLTQ